MKRLIIQPEGWPCKFSECRPGHFLWGEYLCLKSEYGDGEAFNEAGEAFWGGITNAGERAELTVQPVNPVWEEYEE